MRPTIPSPFLFFHFHLPPLLSASTERVHSRFLATSSLIASAWKAEVSPFPSPCSWRNVERHRDQERKKVSSNLGESAKKLLSERYLRYSQQKSRSRYGIRFACSMINSWNLSVFVGRPFFVPREYNDKGNLRRFVFDKGSLWLVYFVELESYIGAMQSLFSFFLLFVNGFLFLRNRTFIKVKGVNW